MEFLEVPLFDDDLYKLLVRFLFDLTFLGLIVFCYFANQKNKRYVFTFLLMNVVIFFICFTLKKLDLGLGMALGLFAIFAIVRFRTEQIEIKDMTYLFLVIGLAVINALSNKKTSYAELLLTNFILVALVFALEKLLVVPPKIKLNSVSLVYDNLELLKPAKYEELLVDLKNQTGIEIKKIDIKSVDLKSGTAEVVIKYPK